jgi:hypothetical protein
MKKNVDFSIFLKSGEAYGVASGVLEVSEGLSEGDAVSILLGHGDKFASRFDGFDGELRVEKIVSVADFGVGDVVMFEDVVINCRDDAERFARYLESEFDLFVVRNEY